MAAVVVRSLLFRDVEVDGRRTNVAVVGEVIAAIGADVGRGDVVIDGDGGALLPGLTDHHLHLFAMAAAAGSVDLAGATSYDAVARAARTLDRMRVVGWDDEALGDLDRDRLDAMTGTTPTRVQHRSGALWVLNSAALAELDASSAPDGAERDADGRLTGKVWRADDWLRGESFPDLAEVGARLASYGITSVTDATPDLDDAAVATVVAAVDAGELPQRVHLLGTTEPVAHPRVSVGPRKLVVADHELPLPDDLAAVIAESHAEHRPVAIHCVSRAALATTIAALRSAGALPGDRIEHCAVADEAALREVAALGVLVVTQPSLVASRGDDYLDRHDPDEHADLWRYRSLQRCGIAVACSSDAPYGDPDPWATMRAARDRRTPSGRVLGESERVDAAAVLAGLLTSPADPAGPPRRVAAGEPADLVLLAVPLDVALTDPTADHVVTTLVGGESAHS